MSTAVDGRRLCAGANDCDAYAGHEEHRTATRADSADGASPSALLTPPLELRHLGRTRDRLGHRARRVLVEVNHG
jgi:hypothetical protein